MSQLEINGVNLPIDPGIFTWNQLLLDLESKHLAKGKVIAKVQFDGNEIPEFREPRVLNCPLHSISEVKVEAVAMEEMVKEAIGQTEGYLLDLQQSMINVAEIFRNQLPDQANDNLNQLFHGLKMFVALLQGIELSLQNKPKQGVTHVEKIFNEMGSTLESLIEAQSQKDWILVADILEFELTANLSSFEQTILEFRQKLGPA